MEKTILIDEINYTITDDQMIHQVDELIFELKNGRELKHTCVVGLWDDLLGLPIQKVWKVLDKKPILEKM